jgi:S1-C subfamily serine protease
MGPFGRQPVLDGVVIREVVPNSPADKVGLQKDKIIAEVNGQKVHTPKDYYAAMAKAGGEVDLTVLSFDGRQADHVKIENKN